MTLLPSSLIACFTIRGRKYLPPFAMQAVTAHICSGVAIEVPWPMDNPAVSCGVMTAEGFEARQARLPGRIPESSFGSSMPVRLPIPTMAQPSTMAFQPMVPASMLKYGLQECWIASGRFWLPWLPPFML